MQLNLGFSNPNDQQQPRSSPTAAEAATPWHKLHPAVQADALQILARIIAAMLVAAPTPENSHE